MRSTPNEAASPKNYQYDYCDGFFKKNQTQINIILITLIPTIILICSTFVSLWFLQDTSIKMIEDFAEELYQDQIHNSKLQNTALVFQLNQQVQKIAWQMNMLNEFLGSVLLGDVVKNMNHIPAIHNIDRSYYDDDDPNVLAMFKRNPVLTSVWQYYLTNQHFKIQKEKEYL